MWVYAYDRKGKQIGKAAKKGEAGEHRDDLGEQEEDDEEDETAQPHGNMEFEFAEGFKLAKDWVQRVQIEFRVPRLDGFACPTKEHDPEKNALLKLWLLRPHTHGARAKEDPYDALLVEPQTDEEESGDSESDDDWALERVAWQDATETDTENDSETSGDEKVARDARRHKKKCRRARRAERKAQPAKGIGQRVWEKYRRQQLRAFERAQVKLERLKEWPDLWQTKTALAHCWFQAGRGNEEKKRSPTLNVRTTGTEMTPITWADNKNYTAFDDRSRIRAPPGQAASSSGQARASPGVHALRPCSCLRRACRCFPKAGPLRIRTNGFLPRAGRDPAHSRSVSAQRTRVSPQGRRPPEGIWLPR